MLTHPTVGRVKKSNFAIIDVLEEQNGIANGNEIIQQPTDEANLNSFGNDKLFANQQYSPIY